MAALYRMVYQRATMTEEIRYSTVPNHAACVPEATRPPFYHPLTVNVDPDTGNVLTARYYNRHNPHIHMTARLVATQQPDDLAEYHDGYTTYPVKPFPQPITAQE